jgi:hypothetical protein
MAFLEKNQIISEVNQKSNENEKELISFFCPLYHTDVSKERCLNNCAHPTQNLNYSNKLLKF